MFTDEQIEFINDNTSRVLIGQSLAGTGKTTTLVEKFKGLGLYKILYLVYNKSMAEDAKKAMRGLNHVTVSTFHSLAYQNVGHEYKHKLILDGSYTPMNIIQDIGLDAEDYEYAYNLLKFYNEFLLSGSYYIDVYLKDNIIDFAHKDRVRNDIIKLFNKMANPADDTMIEHDFYSYLYHLSKPNLNHYDILAIDESQDSNLNILEICKSFKGKMYLIGDQHQNIYAWRNTINLMDMYKNECKVINFTKSFRVSQPTADICNKMYRDILGIDLNMKGLNPKNRIVKDIDRSSQHTIICRKRMAIFDKAYDYAEKSKFISFEGGLRTYGFDLLIDAWFFMLGKSPKNQLLKKFENWRDFIVYVEESGDEEFALVVNLVKIKGYKIVDMYNKIKEFTVTKNSNTYDVLFTTVHKSKGQTYKTPMIVSDDIADLNRIRGDLATIDNDYHKELYIKKVTEEINVTYVAITRCDDDTVLPEHMLRWFSNNDDFIL